MQVNAKHRINVWKYKIIYLWSFWTKCMCVFSAPDDDKPGQSWGDLHEKKTEEKKKVLVHLAIVRNEEFQQLGPAQSERSKEWMSLFSSFSFSLGAPLCSVQRPIVAMSLSSPHPQPLCAVLRSCSPPVFTHRLCAQAPLYWSSFCFVFLPLFWKKI